MRKIEMKLGIGYFQRMETQVMEQTGRNQVSYESARTVSGRRGSGGRGEDDQRDTSC
jgi:hypothetical protein